MSCRIEVLFTPADFQTLPHRDLARTTCVVFDVLRATSSFVTALHNGATGILPVAEIAPALEARRQQPDVLLAGERDGLRISAALTGGVEFDLGNSPREYTPARVAGKTIVSTTTNGTRALRACAGAERILAGSFLNLAATADYVVKTRPENLIVICAGTHERTALEDALGAGALCEALAHSQQFAVSFVDSAEMARRLFRGAGDDLPGVLGQAENARRLLIMPDLRDDIAFCVQRDVYPVVAEMGEDGIIRKL